MRTNRLILLALAGALVAVAASVCALQGAGALAQLGLDALPFLLVATLLVSGRFVGEERILARRAPRRAPRLRADGRPRPHSRDRSLARLLERGPHTLRGPPARLAAV